MIHNRIIRRKKTRNVVGSWPVLIMLSIVAVWFSGRAFDMYQRFAFNEQELERVKQEQAALLERTAYYKDMVGRLQSEEGIEEEIRNRLPYAKAGETVVLIVQDDTSTTTHDVNVLRESSWWRFWR